MTVVRTLLAYVAWNLAASAALLLAPPPWSAAAVLLLLWLFVDGMLPARKPRERARRAARLRLRPLPRAAWGPLAAAALLSLAFSWALSAVWAGLVPLDEASVNPFGPLMATPGSRLAVTLYVVAVAPVVEELVFRGVVQRRWERRLGPGWGLFLTAFLFAGIHGLPKALPLLLALGLVFGWAVRVTRSLWPAVVIHVVHNASGMMAMRLTPVDAAEPTIWQTGPTLEWGLAIAATLVIAAAAVPLARLVRRAARNG